MYLSNSFVKKIKQTSFDKKSYMTYIRGYMKKLLAKLKEDKPDRVEIFQKNIQEWVKKVLANFDDYQFFQGENVISFY
jgi:ribosome recycling factor